MKKDGYTWEDLNKAWWEGFDTCKAKAGEANLKSLAWDASKHRTSNGGRNRVIVI